eukprot:7828389-Pyramimonas_sp.AAC.1
MAARRRTRSGQRLRTRCGRREPTALHRPANGEARTALKDHRRGFTLKESIALTHDKTMQAEEL